MRRHFKSILLGEYWDTEVISHRVFQRRYKKSQGKSTIAITFMARKLMVFDADCFCLTTILHELTHAYLEELDFDSAFLNEAQSEEIICELLGNKILEILKTAFEIWYLWRPQEDSLKTYHSLLQLITAARFSNMTVNLGGVHVGKKEGP